MSLEACRFWRGRLQVWQPRRKEGYRFNLDAVLLAAFCPPARRVLDLGAGCGIIGLMLLASGRAQRVVALERQPLLLAAAARNVRGNGLGRRMWVQAGDVREAFVPRVDLVVFNPPFYRLAHGRPSPSEGRRLGRHEAEGTLADFAAAAARALGGRGRVAAVVPASRASELCAVMATAGLGLIGQVAVVPRVGTPPIRALMAFGRGRPTAPASRRPWALHPCAGGERFHSRLRPWIEEGRAS